MILQEYSDAVMIPAILRMIGLPDTPESRTALHKFTIAELAAMRAASQKEAA